MNVLNYVRQVCPSKCRKGTIYNLYRTKSFYCICSNPMTLKEHCIRRVPGKIQNEIYINLYQGIHIKLRAKRQKMLLVSGLNTFRCLPKCNWLILFLMQRGRLKIFKCLRKYIFVMVSARNVLQLFSILTLCQVYQTLNNVIIESSPKLFIRSVFYKYIL